jgi:hypothetical protein
VPFALALLTTAALLPLQERNSISCGTLHRSYSTAQNRARCRRTAYRKSARSRGVEISILIHFIQKQFEVRMKNLDSQLKSHFALFGILRHFDGID